jgi:hypothetical protein
MSPPRRFRAFATLTLGLLATSMALVAFWALLVCPRGLDRVVLGAAPHGSQGAGSGALSSP